MTIDSSSVAFASAWAFSFTEAVQSAETTETDADITITLTQAKNLPITRKIALGNYLLVGTLGMLTLSIFGILFFKGKD